MKALSSWAVLLARKRREARGERWGRQGMVKITCAHGFHLVLVQRGGLSPVREDGGTVKPGDQGRGLRGEGAALRRTHRHSAYVSSGI